MNFFFLKLSLSKIIVMLIYSPIQPFIISSYMLKYLKEYFFLFIYAS